MMRMGLVLSCVLTINKLVTMLPAFMGKTSSELRGHGFGIQPCQSWEVLGVDHVVQLVYFDWTRTSDNDLK